jgi:hypothetical protein
MPLSDLVVKGRPGRLREEPTGAGEAASEPGRQVVVDESADESAVDVPDAGCVRS